MRLWHRSEKPITPQSRRNDLKVFNMRVHLSALGCRLNEAELERWASAFHKAGDSIASSADDADVLVLNSCAVTREAVAKSRRKLTRLQRENPAAKLVLTGCWSELESPGALASHGIDLVVANTDKERLVPLTRAAFVDPAMPAAATRPAESALFQRSRQRAFVKIQDGCRWRCTYCIVTVARGEEVSRSMADLVNEVNELNAAGVNEIVLTGVHVGGYGSDIGSSLESLVRSLLNDTDMPRIRFASVEPWDLTPGFLAVLDNPRVLPHMHLPLQSGCDATLKRMARRCRTEEFDRLFTELRTRVPEFNVTTDLICGFPGESDGEWQTTMDFVASQPFGDMHVFAYSEREGTAAASMGNPVPIETRRARSREMHSLAEHLREARLQHAIGTQAEVLWERGRLKPDGMLEFSGYTPNYHKVITHSLDDLTGQLTLVQIDSAEEGRLIGTVGNTGHSAAGR